MTTVTELAEQPYVGITKTVTMTTFGLVGDRIGEMIGWLAERGAAPAGAPFFRYHLIGMEGELLVEAGVPVATPVEGEGEIQAGVLPGGRYVTTTHHGHPDQLIGVTAGLLAWAAEQGLKWDMTTTPQGERWGCRLERFLTNPMVEPDLDKWDTELAFRLADG